MLVSFFVEGTEPVMLDEIVTNDIVIIVVPDGDSYFVKVGQKGFDCFVDCEMPSREYVIPNYQMVNFMSCLVISCYKSYRNYSESKDQYYEERKNILTKIKKLK
ncbi:hypothetical protein QTN25_007738 [Entamoeba marina]